MNKVSYIWKILVDRIVRPYDDVILRFNTKAGKDDPLVWRVIVNGNENLASSFEIHGYVYDVLSEERGVTKYNVGCKGRVRWEGTKAVILAAGKAKEDIFI